MENKRYTILTTYDDGFTYEDYVEYCEEMGYEPAEEDSEEYYEWVQEEVDCNYESDIDNIKCCKQYNVPVVINGVLGLWDGEHTIVPVEMNSVYDAIEKCIGRYGEYVKAEYEDGVIYVAVSHHDGTNHFEITAKEGKLPYLYNIV